MTRALTAYSSLWVVWFALTLLLELPLVALSLPKGSRGRGALAALIANGVTHPLLWFGFPRVLPMGWAIALGEAFAVALEAAAIRFGARITVRRATLLSLAVNLYSWGMGEIITRALVPQLAEYWWGPRALP